MIWLTWRQHRAAIGAFLSLFGVLAVLYLIEGAHLHHAFDRAGLSQCVGVRNDASCGSRRADFINFDVGFVAYLGPLLTLASGAFGVFIGAPLIAGEIERGTYQWAWTQRVSRSRWLAIKYVVLTTVLLAISVGFAAVYRWANAPVAALTGPLTPFGSFDNTPLMLATYTLFGFAVGVVAGTFIRRTVAAMGATLFIFLAFRIGITIGVRPHYMPLVTVASDATDAGRPLGFDPRDLDWSSRWVDASGHTIAENRIAEMVNPAVNPQAAGLSEPAILQKHGIHYVDAIQPYHRAPIFQLIEFAIYLALIAGCAALTFWRIHRRAM